MQKARVFTDGSTGTQWYVRIVECGDRYGLHDDRAEWEQARPGVIFYDFDYAHQGGFGPMGQQVSSYFLDTLTERPYGQGLSLDMGIDKWQIHWGTFSEIRRFLLDAKEELSKESHSSAF